MNHFSEYQSYSFCNYLECLKGVIHDDFFTKNPNLSEQL